MSEGKETEGLRNPDEKVSALRPFDRLRVVSKVEPQIRTDRVSTSRGSGGGPQGTGPFRFHPREKYYQDCIIRPWNDRSPEALYSNSIFPLGTGT